MGDLHYLSVSLHLLAAIFWLGGMFFLAVIGAPVLRRVEPAALRVRIFEELGRRFRTVGWSLIGILVVTGVLNLRFRGLLDPVLLGSAVFWNSPSGRALLWKLFAVGAMVLFSASHDFVLGPAASRSPPDSVAALQARQRASWAARLNALAGLAVVLAAVRLARGG